MKRRTLIRLLVGFAIGIPIVVELATFLGLVEHRLFADDGRDDETETPRGRRVGVGDEMLPATTPTEEVTAASIRGTQGGWRLVITVKVENPTDAAYEFQLGDVVLANGNNVEGDATTGEIRPGESATVTGAWEIPTGSTPDAVSAVGITTPPEGTPTRVREDVLLAKIPVTGG